MNTTIQMASSPIPHILAAGYLLILLAGCASSSHTYLPVQAATAGPVYYDPSRDDFPVQFRQTVIAVLEKHNFTLTNGPTAMVVTTQLNHAGATDTARVTLRRNYQTLVESRAENYGWGNLMARGAALENIIKTSINTFDRELGAATRQ